MSNDLIPLKDQQMMAEAIVKSGFYGFKDINQVMAVMVVAQAENKHPGTVVQEYDIIQGRPALKSQAILARFQQAGGKIEYHAYTDDKVEMTFSHPSGGSLKLAWTLKQAQEIGLASKDNWKKYPRAMLKARVVSEGVRAVYPACILGHYAVEEVQDFEPRKAAEIVVPKIDLNEQADDDPEIYVPLYVPNPDGSLKLYKKCFDDAEFESHYRELCDKITKAKISDEQKADKFYDLKAANEETLNRIG
jgi:hypothetical protein